jgi:hypothetical protein
VVLQGLFLTKTKGELSAMVDMTEQRVEAFEDGNNKVGRAGCAMGSNLQFQLFRLATRFLAPVVSSTRPNAESS